MKNKALMVLGCLAGVQAAAGIPEPGMVRIPAGAFQMGSMKGEAGREGDEAPRHAVRIARPFFLSKYEVTEKEWGACVADGACAAVRQPRGDAYPVTDVRWKEAQAYAAWLSARTGKRYRLPTEAEWEYAARAGSDAPYVTGATVEPRQANYAASSVGAPAPVGRYAPNAFGLYDMAGNVWEWVADCFDERGYYAVPRDGSAFAGSDCQMHVLRGGGFDTRPEQLRVAYRFRAQFGGDSVGLRVALEDER